MNTVRHFLFLLTTALLLAAAATPAAAQEFSVDVFRKITENAGTDSARVGTERVGNIYYGHFNDYSRARDIARRMRQAAEEGRNANEIYAIIREPGGDNSRSGHFSFPTGDAVDGMGIVIYTADRAQVYLLRYRAHHQGAMGVNSDSPDQEYEASIVQRGDSVNLTLLITTQEVQNVNKRGQMRRPPISGGMSMEIDDGNVYFDFHINTIPSDIRKSHSRLVLLPYVIDCATDDTIAYLPPAVYEGQRYHRAQIRRRSYDYLRNDPLGRERADSILYATASDTLWHDTTYYRLVVDANGHSIPLKTATGSDSVDANGELVVMRELRHERFISKVIQTGRDTLMAARGYQKPLERVDDEGGMLHIDTVIVFRKPDKAGHYRGMLRYLLDDYHHVYFSDEYPGTCLQLKPFKFLELATATADMPLRPEYYERPAEGRIASPTKNLGMRFHYNSAQLIEDSVYHTTIDELQEEMRSITAGNGRVTKAMITAYSSPDGPEHVNLELAARRADKALSVIHLPEGTHLDRPRCIIDTWDNTAKLLEAEGHTAEAAQLRACIAEAAGRREVAGRRIAALPFYKETVKPVLERQCRMEFVYEYVAQRVMKPQEALEKFRQQPNYPFAQGDYYNIFSLVTDSAETDRLTDIAYDRIIRRNAMYGSLFAPFIICKKAQMDIRNGRPDSTTLKPLIADDDNPYAFRINTVKHDDFVIYNRPEIVLNQAVTLYLMGEPKRAQFFIDRLKAEGVEMEGLTQMDSYINFKTLLQIANRTQKQEDDFRRALHFIEQSADDNRAVLYTEFPQLGRHDDAWPYVEAMDDDNPRKWYLLALLWAAEPDEGVRRMEAERLQMGEQFPMELLPKSDDEFEPANPIPVYLAYFQHAFDIDKSPSHEMMRHYFSEGHIPETLRQKTNHAYKLSRVTKYRELFALRQKVDHRK